MRLALGVAILAGGVALAGNTSAAQPCWQAVLLDWRDGRVDSVYAVACYRDAIARLPEDLRMYSTAEDEITRALAARIARSPSASRQLAIAPPAVADEIRGSSLPASAILAAALSLLVLALSGTILLVRRLRR
jgi:hypothetical protein